MFPTISLPLQRDSPFWFWVFCLCVCLVPIKTKRDIWLPGAGVIDGCEPPFSCWKSNHRPLEEQHVLWTAEPSLFAMDRDLVDFFLLFCTDLCLSPFAIPGLQTSTASKQEHVMEKETKLYLTVQMPRKLPRQSIYLSSFQSSIRFMDKTRLHFFSMGNYFH